MCLGGGSSSTAVADEATRQRAEEAARQGRVRAGRDNINSAFSGYDDNFYNDRTQSYIDYATPEVADQFKDATTQLRAALARNGLLQSSISADQNANLNRQNSNALRSVADKGLDYSNQTRSSIEAAKNNLLQQNQGLADPTLAANMAANSASSASTLPSYSPLGQIFAGATDALATQSQLERRGQARYPDTISGIFSPSKTGQVINS